VAPSARPDCVGRHKAVAPDVILWDMVPLENKRALGVAFPPLEIRRDILVRAAIQAEELGYDGFFVAEAWGLDAFALLAEIATKTQRILLGPAIVNVWSRSPATLAMAASTLSSISGDRFVLGLGASTQQLVEGLHDIAFNAPLSQLRRVVTQLRELLSGGRIPLAEGNPARPLRLATEPAAVPIVLAALSSASIRLTGELADGWMPWFFPLSRMPLGMETLATGAAQGRRLKEPCRIWPTLGGAVAADDASARQLAAWWVSFYLTTMGPFYARTLDGHGFRSEVQAVLAANSDRQVGDVPPEAEVLLDELIIYGTPVAARQRLARWYDAGATFPIISLPPNRPWEETEYALQALAPDTATSPGERG
jgi:alkanesulfonate monooxygenase SsuD/methylene tetrahydromethanopterin reductase-like flavin-dependent oxidoreductase (luciferase family)